MANTSKMETKKVPVAGIVPRRDILNGKGL